MFTVMLDNRDTKILRNRMIAATLAVLAFCLLLAHAKYIYVDSPKRLVACCEQPSHPIRSSASLSHDGSTVEFNLSAPYQLTPQELSQVSPIPPDEWILGERLHGKQD